MLALLRMACFGKNVRGVLACGKTGVGQLLRMPVNTSGWDLG